MRLYLDYETRSVVDLETRGLDNYARDKSTRVLMCAYAFDSGPVSLWEAHKGDMPAELRGALEDPFVVKVAYNARFEKQISEHCLGVSIPYSEFVDVMIWARHLSMALHLAEVCRVLELPPDEAKLDPDKRLVRMFGMPASPGGEETLFGLSEPSFRDWQTNPLEWQEFCEYCRRDVVAERAILKRMKRFPLPAQEQRAWVMDQRINDRGVPISMKLVSGATAVATTAKSYLRNELKQLTGVENVNSNPQMLTWLHTQGYSFSSLAKGFVDRALQGE